MVASQNGHNDIVKLLLDNGANIEANWDQVYSNNIYRIDLPS